MTQTEFTVEGMSCQHCAKTVTQALEKVEGVQSAQVDLESKTARVIFDDGPVNEDTLFDAIRQHDYTPVKKN